MLVGDITHHKAKSHWRDVADLVELFKTCPVPLLGIPGNHDITAGRYESYKDLPVGILEKSGVLRIPDPMVMFSDDEVKVELYGMQFKYTVTPEMFPQQPKNPGTTRILLTHEPFVMRPPSYPMEVWTFDEISTWGIWDININGHMHELVESKVCQNGRIVVNTGSICRAVLDPDKADRQIQVPIVEVTKDGSNVSWRTLSVRPFSTVFDVTKYIAKKHNEAVFANFTDELAKEAAAAQVQDIRSLVTSLHEFGSLSQPEQDLVRHYLAAADV